MDILKKNKEKKTITFYFKYWFIQLIIFFFQIAQKHEFLVDSFSRYVSIQEQLDDMSSLFSFSPNFYLHFLPLFLLPEGDYCWNLKSEKGGSKL